MIACAPEPHNTGGFMDDPQTHFKQGMNYWNESRYQPAEEEFNRARSLDFKYAPAYSGLALTTAKKAQSDSNRRSTASRFKEAIKLADKAQELNSKLPLVFIIKGIVITMKNESRPAKEWLEEAEEEYGKAIKIDPANSEAYYRRGICYKNACEFPKASDDFRKVLDLNKDFAIPANEQWELMQKIERASPGTDVGKKIALADKISRADIAALFVSELKIDKLVTMKHPATDFKEPDSNREINVDSSVKIPEITDIANHWAKNFIYAIVALQIRGLEPYPDNTFRPDQFVNRGEYALTIEAALIAISGDNTLATKHITESRFSDVNQAHPAYNAICTVVDKNIMSAEFTGAFGIEKPVSGADALLIIRNLKSRNKIE